MNEDNPPPVTPPEVEFTPYHHRNNIFKNTKFLSLLVLAVVLPVMTLLVVSGKQRLGSYASETPATPPSVVTWSNLTASTPLSGPAVFNFDVSGITNLESKSKWIDISTSPNFNSNVYDGFSTGIKSPLIANNVSVFPNYVLNQLLYWRVRIDGATGGTNFYASPVQTTTVIAFSPPPVPYLVVFSNLSASTPVTGPAVFKFSSTGDPGGPNYIVDLSTKADFSRDVYLSFGYATASPITISNPLKWDKYVPGQDLYWRVRTAHGVTSEIQTMRVGSPVSLTPTPLPTAISCSAITAWYKMDQTPNNTVIDSVNNLNGTLSGATLVSGYKNSGLTFNGTANNYVTIPSSYGLKSTNMSIGAWVNIPNTQVKGAFVKIGNSTSGVGLGVGNGNFENPGNEVVVSFEHTRWIPTGLKIPADGNWHYVTLVVNNAGVPFVYLDGVTGKSDGYGGNLLIIPPQGNVSAIGGYTSSGNTSRFVNAQIDEVGIWKRALTANEVIQLARGADCTQMVTTPTSAPDTRIIGGKVTSSCTGAGVANVGISLFNSSWGNAWSYATTDANGNFRIYNRARVNDGYQVAITGIPTGYSSVLTPAAPNNLYTHNWCALNANTPGGSIRYDCQKVGSKDCAGANAAGAKYRCNFIAKCN